VKLLRLIETGAYRRVGGVQPLRADFRLVAATHRDLKTMVREGTFRSDLYYRISAYPIHLPALRHRREDIPLLAESLLSRVRPDRHLALTDEARRALVSYDFPGNIRELRNILERASLLTDGERITGEHVPAEVSGEGPSVPTVLSAPRVADESALRSAERHAFERALDQHGGSRRALAQALGISERTLYRKLAAFGLSSRR
jgi:transcriptional regulator with PAS, ATPase and Fis domain